MIIFQGQKYSIFGVGTGRKMTYSMKIMMLDCNVSRNHVASIFRVKRFLTASLHGITTQKTTT
jgi:hypothetical protein